MVNQGLVFAYISDILILVFLGYSIFKIKQRNDLHLFFNLTLALMFVWNTSIILMFYFPDSFIVLHNISYIGISLTPVTFMLTAYTFAKTRIVNKLYVIPFLIIPLVSLVVLWTNGHHHLFFIKDSFDNSEIIYGDYFIIHALYSYICIFVAFSVLVFFSIKNSGLFSKQALFVVAGSMIPVTMNVLMTLKLIEVAIYWDIIFFTAAMACYFYAFIKHDFLNITPIALQQVVDHISESFIVVDTAFYIIYHNRAFVDTFRPLYRPRRKQRVFEFLTLLELRQEQIIGMSKTALNDKHGVSVEKVLLLRGTQQSFVIEFTSIIIKDRYIGTIILFKNITEQKVYIEKLELKNRELDRANEELTSQKQEIEQLNVKLRELAETDGLTGAYNRRFFNEYHDIEIHRVRNQIEHEVKNGNSGINFGIAIIDIDDFKKINDEYGHQTGDRVLQDMVSLIKQITFSRDILCRYGGEEFAIIFTKTDREGALQASMKILETVRDYRFDFGNGNTEGRITVSIGFASFDRDYSPQKTDILKIADERLYQAKRSGKNRVVWE